MSQIAWIVHWNTLIQKHSVYMHNLLYCTALHHWWQCSAVQCSRKSCTYPGYGRLCRLFPPQCTPNFWQHVLPPWWPGRETIWSRARSITELQYDTTCHNLFSTSTEPSNWISQSQNKSTKTVLINVPNLKVVFLVVSTNPQFGS